MTKKEISQILTHWEIPQIASFKQASSGLLNQTFIVRVSNNDIYVLQKLHHAISLPGCSENYFHVTHYLEQMSKNPTQTLIKTVDGKLFYTQEINGESVENNHRSGQGPKKLQSKNPANIWRLLKGVEGEVYTRTKNPKLAFEGGKLLSKFHADLKQYKKRLAPTLPMFQYDQTLTTLKAHRKNLLLSGDKDISEATEFIVSELPQLLLPSSLPKQIIHTDPKISNFLFTKKGKGVCMIDLDTIQSLSPLYDIGDALRSWSGQEEDDPANKADMRVYKNFLSGYLGNKRHPLSRKEKDLIPQACKLVTLGLAARFLNDYKEDNYFGWDKTRYKSRKAHNKARTLGQLSLYKSLLQD